MSYKLRNVVLTVVLLVIAISFILLTGCTGPSGGGSSPGWKPWKPFTVETNLVPVVEEVPEVVTLETNGNEVVATVVPRHWRTNMVEAPVYKVNEDTIQAANGLRGVNKFNPTPTQAPIDWGIGAVVAVLGGVAQWWTSRAKSKVQQKLSKKEELLGAVITGVETANDPKIKDKIRELATFWGVEKDLNAVVKEQTASGKGRRES